MSVRVQPVSVLAWANSTLVLMSRAVGLDAALITQASIDSITYTVTKAGEVVAGPTSLTVADVVFDALQTDARWDVDATGYNFRFSISPSLILDEDEVYVIRADATPATGTAFCLGVWRVQTRPDESVCD